MAALVSGDAEAFYAAEIADREIALMPPFGRLVALVVSGEDKHETESFARTLARAAPTGEGVDVLGPAEAPLAVVRGRYRFRLLAHGGRSAPIQAYVRRWLGLAGRIPAGVKLSVDVDPQSFL